jgi:hypothetical protein
MLAAVCGSIGSPTMCHAEPRCPWLNAATAGGFLGGTVQENTAPLSLVGDTTCEFSRTQNSTVFTLRIAVHTMEHPSKDFAAYLAKCGGSSAPLKAVGNEAVQCTGSAAKGEQQVVGRVRDRAFVLTVTTDPPGRAGASSESGREGISDEFENLAEQIAGALF